MIAGSAREGAPRIVRFLNGVGFAAGAAAALAGCAGRNVHPDLFPDTQVMTRGWVFPTRTSYDANDRGFDYSNAVVFENTLVFGNSAQGVTSLYPGLQRVRWRFPVPHGVVSELGVDRKNVVFGGGDGFLYCLNAETGKRVWRYEMKQSLASRPAFAQGRVFITTPDDTIHALDAATGKLIWTYRRRVPQGTTVHAASSPLVNGNTVIAGLSDGFVVAVSLEEGQLKWERKLQLSTKFTDVDAAPVLSGDTILIPSYDGALYALKDPSGDTLWRFDAGGARKVTVDEQTIYLPSSNGTVYALAKANAKLLWQFDLDRGVPTQVETTDRYVIFASSYQYLYVLDKTTGKGIYRFNAGDGSGFSGNPLLDRANDALYLLSMAGNLYQFKLRPAGAKAPDAYRFDSAYRSARTAPGRH